MYTVSLDVSPIAEAIQRLEPNGTAQYFFANELMKLSDSYVPYRTGLLKDTAYVESDGTAIVYPQPYARIMWYGKVMVDPITNKAAFFEEGYGYWSRPKKYGIKKVESERTFNYNQSPRRGSMWVYRAFIDNKQQLIQDMTDFITKGQQ